MGYIESEDRRLESEDRATKYLHNKGYYHCSVILKEKATTFIVICAKCNVQTDAGSRIFMNLERVAMKHMHKDGV